MITRLSHITVLVRDQDEALSWYVDTLGFEKRVDEVVSPDVRFLTVAPRGQAGPQIVLERPMPELHGKEWKEIVGRIGTAAAVILETDDCRKDHRELSVRGVQFSGPPMETPRGIVAVFRDLYGNSFMLLEPRAFA